MRLLVVVIVLFANMWAVCCEVPQFHPPLWTATLPQTTAMAPQPSIASNDFALYTLVNNTATSYHPRSGKEVWTATLPFTMELENTVLFAASNRWLVVMTALDIFVMAASSGLVASHTTNYTDGTAILPTQLDNTFIVNNHGSNLNVVQVMPSGPLWNVWTSNFSDVSAVGIVSTTNYMYYLAPDPRTSLPMLYVLDLLSFMLHTFDGVIAIASTPMNGRMAVVRPTAGGVSMLDAHRLLFLWNNSLENAFWETTQVFLVQTAGAVLVAGVMGELTPLFTLDATTGELLGNQSAAYSNSWGNDVMASTVAGGRVVLVGTQLDSDPPQLFTLDPTDGRTISMVPVPVLVTVSLHSIGHGNVVVPNGQGFATFDARNTSAPLSYNMITCPGPVGIVTFPTDAMQLFVLLNAQTLAAFASRL